ncbi:unnamed protein product [Onchocerca flexuosa]|uniref:Mobile element protein n=1 Tax=Onchocerca flexuosa TaxID=387005 RepID=A0A183I7L2_9BILA|nr:unnamed protein product [Onchocerca flexuosa]
MKEAVKKEIGEPRKLSKIRFQALNQYPLIDTSSRSLQRLSNHKNKKKNGL